MSDVKYNDVIFMNGVFDLLHIGHFNFFAHAYELKKRYNLKAVLALDSDEKVRLDKGENRPLFSIVERVDNISYIKIENKQVVDQVLVFDTNEELSNMIKNLNPLYLLKGDNWKKNVVGEEYAGKVLYYPIHKTISTTKIIEKILRANK